MKILVFIDHDIIIRHFLHAQVFDELVRKHEVVFVFPELGNKRIKSDRSALELGRAAVRILPVSFERLKIWQRLLLADILRWRPGIHHAAMRRFHRHSVGPRAAILHTVLALPGIFSLFRAWSRHRIRAMPYRDLEALIDAERPDAMIHPSVLAGVYINDLIDVSGSTRIPLVVIMNSWDNPSTKRAMSGRPDWLLVWGPQTQAHAERYLGIPAERAVCFGAAQFDVYRHPPRTDRNEFCSRHDIPPAARILLYAGSSKGTDEFGHLRMLEDAIEHGDLGATVVVYRPHPWGDGGKGGSRILDRAWRHVRIEQTMRGYLESIKSGPAGITTPDYRHTHDLLSAVDAVVSPLSTILIEGALHGKPTLCFLPDENDATSLFTLALPLVHFEDLFAETSFLVARGERSLVPAVRGLLDKIGDANFARDQQVACGHFVTSFDQPYGERLLRFVEGAIPFSGRPRSQ